MTNIILNDVILSFGHASKEEKKQYLRENALKKIYMDLTCYDPEEFYDEFSQLKGSFAALFADQGKKIEIHYREKSAALEAKFSELGFTLVETTIVSCGFVLPRTVAQIINEAYFALEEGVASREDINRAMKFGVNYPKGPFDWAAGREHIVRTLLQELLTKTGDRRYVAASSLA
jgi:3-hydroxybutyryl-CoA dehydrogenase